MSEDLISRETVKNLLLDSKPIDLQPSDINFLTGDIKVSLKFVLNIIDNAEPVTSQALYNGIVEIISKNGLTTVEELLEILKKGAKND